MTVLPDADRTDWYAVGAVTLGIGVFATAQGLTYPLFALLLESRDIGAMVIGTHVAAFMLGLIAAALVIPHVVTRVGASALMVGAFAGAAGVLGSFALTDHLVVWLFLRFGLGFCVNIIYVVGEAWLSVASGRAVRGRIVGLYGAVMSGGFALGPLAIPIWGIEGNSPFIYCGMLVATAAFLFSLAVRRTTVRPTPSAAGKMLVFAKAAPTLLLMVVLFGALDATFLSVVPGYLARLGAPPAQAALVVTAVHIGMVAAQPILGVLLDRYSYRGCVAGCLLTASASFAVLAFLPVDSPALLFVAAAGGAAFFGIYVAALAALGHRFSGGMLLSGTSAFGLAYASGGMIGPLGIGLVSAVTPAATFPALAVLAAVGLLLLAPANPAGQRR